MDKNMDRPIEDMRLAQIGFLVNDIEKTKKEFARFFGVEEPETVNSGVSDLTRVPERLQRPGRDMQVFTDLLAC